MVLGVNKMFIAMNRFKIKRGKESNFEKIWNERDTYLENIPDFKQFNLIRGKVEETFSLWDNKKDFENWTKSKAFRIAHKSVGGHSDIYLGHPVFEGF